MSVGQHSNRVEPDISGTRVAEHQAGAKRLLSDKLKFGELRRFEAN